MQPAGLLLLEVPPAQPAAGAHAGDEAGEADAPVGRRAHRRGGVIGNNLIQFNGSHIQFEGLFWLRAESPARGKGASARAPAADVWRRPRSKGQPVDLEAMPYIPELATVEARQRFEFGWAYYRHGSGGTIPDFWILPSRTP